MEIKYDIVFSRRRLISIIVAPDEGLVVRAPFRMPLKAIDKFVRDKEEWIKKHTERSSEIIRLNHSKKYVDGEKYLFLGRELTLCVRTALFPSINQLDNILEVITDGKECRVRMLLEEWYRKKAEDFIHGKFKEILARHRNYSFSPAQMVVRPMKSRWGSCTSKGKITISSVLIKLDERFTEYVIIHELCHLKFHNHGKEFYKLLEELYPDYKTIRKDLRKYITK